MKDLGFMALLISVIAFVLAIYGAISSVKTKKALRDYQIELYNDTVWIYDKGRFVGKFIHTSDSSWNNPYDSIFIKDNL